MPCQKNRRVTKTAVLGVSLLINGIAVLGQYSATSFVLLQNSIGGHAGVV